MKKKILLILVLCLSLMLTACTNNAKKDNAQSNDASVNAEELVMEGYDYLSGSNGKERDIHKALEYFEKADDLGNPDGSFWVGWVYDIELIEGQENDFNKAREYYEKCQEENPIADICLGIIYLCGQGIKTDEAKADEYFDKAVKLLESGEYSFDKYPYASAYMKGFLYEYGYSVDQDYVKARELYEIAADAGNSYAMTYLSGFYMYGTGGDQDTNKAKELLEKAVALDNEVAIDYLGSMYENGEGVDRDYEKAMEYYTKAVDLGFYFSMINIGALYENGYGVEQDYSKALEWYKKAADVGLGEGQEAYDALKQKQGL